MFFKHRCVLLLGLQTQLNHLTCTITLQVTQFAAFHECYDNMRSTSVAHKAILVRVWE